MTCPLGQLLFARKIPLFSQLADNSTFTPLQQIATGTYRLDWAEVKAGHFISDTAFLAVGFLLLSLAMSSGKHYVKRDVISLLIRAGRVWGALWCGVTALCLLIAAIDIHRLPLERGEHSLWTVVFALIAAGLIAAGVKGLRRLKDDRVGVLRSDILVRMSGLIVAFGCASLLHIVDFPPQTALGWVVVQLSILGVPAGIGLVLSNQTAEETMPLPDRILKGARYFSAWDFTLAVLFVYMLVRGNRLIPELWQSYIAPPLQALLLSICLFNRVPEKEIAENSRSLFGNVLGAAIALRLCVPAAQFDPSTATLLAFMVCLILSLRVAGEGEIAPRKWWQQGRFWAISAAFGWMLYQYLSYSAEKIGREGGAMLIVAIYIFAILIDMIIRRKIDLRRLIRFTIISVLAFICATVLWRRYSEGGPFPSWTESSMLSLKIGAIVTLPLILVVLVFKRPAILAARVLRGRPARLAVYAAMVVIAILARGLNNYPSLPFGLLHYSSAPMLENGYRALEVLSPESTSASGFLQQSIFGDINGARADSLQVWAGVVGMPAVLPKAFVRIPRLLGNPSQFIAGAARMTRAEMASDTRLDVLYSRRLTGTSLSDHLKLQLMPKRIRRRAEVALNNLKQIEAWREYVKYPRAILDPCSPCRSWNDLPASVVEVAIIALLNSPGHEALKHIWRMDGMPGVTIK
ncbi:MAG: hypothetical protein JW941_09735 [Candidatus Coatesbacteria bacterium]|nr:hypothetical protein [Candidatus Coatesbacteria bacterium]